MWVRLIKRLFSFENISGKRRSESITEELNGPKVLKDQQKVQALQREKIIGCQG